MAIQASSPQELRQRLIDSRIGSVDDEQRRPLAEAAARPVAGGREDRLVALGEELVPDRLRL
jgi:hypothetical protein